MAGGLAITLGQCSDKGRKPINQDFHGAIVPSLRERAAKGICVAIADGISSSEVSHIAAESAVKSFLDDYYCTSDTWSVKTSASRVIAATNAWLYAQTRGAEHDDRDKGYVCTFTSMVIKSATAHVFHVGDARLYRVNGLSLEQLTTDHRVATSPHRSYLGRALGINHDVEIDYLRIGISAGDIFVLATDGVYEHIDPASAAQAIRDRADDLDGAARQIVDAALRNDSADNLTVQIVRVDAVPNGDASEVLNQTVALQPAPLLNPPDVLEGLRVLRTLRQSNRSHIYLAEEVETGKQVALKIPSTDLRADAALLRRFAMEEWVARRIDDAHVLRPGGASSKRQHLYSVMEFIDGKTLTQWMTDNPAPDLETVRNIVEQIARGLRAFHRNEMLHQDVRPENIMIDRSGVVRIIDFGSTRIAGVLEASPAVDHGDMMGTAQYTAPEYLIGEPASPLSDLYSLGVITYQMLTGRLPYGARMAQARTRAQQLLVAYTPASEQRIPVWVDHALRKAVHCDPDQRQQALSEFTHDLRFPRETLARRTSPPLIERSPVLFWQLVSVLLFVAVVVQAIWR